MPDAGQRRAQVALDVDGERLQRADVEHPAAALRLGGQRLAGQPVERPQERRERLAGAGRARRPGRCGRRRSPPRRRPAPRWARRTRRRTTPASRGRSARVEAAGGGHRAILAPGTDARAERGRPAQSSTRQEGQMPTRPAPARPGTRVTCRRGRHPTGSRRRGSGRSVGVVGRNADVGLGDRVRERDPGRQRGVPARAQHGVRRPGCWCRSSAMAPVCSSPPALASIMKDPPGTYRGDRS